MRRVIADLDAAEPVRLAASLKAGKKVPPDVTGLLADDHRTVLGWFQWYEGTSDRAVRERLLPRICAALKAHMAAEEEFLYPVIGRFQAGAASAERAGAEHAEAKKLIEELSEQSPGEAATDRLVAKLKSAITAHIAEEETELFSVARRAPLDLYAIGAAVAARRVEALLKLRTDGTSAPTRTHKEFSMTNIAVSDARDYLLLGLKNAHAMTRQGRVLVAGQVERVESYPLLKAKLEVHLREKDEQLARLERLIAGYGAKPSVVKDAAMSVAAGVAAIASAASADEVVKNSFATLAQAKYEAAAFETLIVFAEAAGEKEALQPLQKCLSESRGLASFVEENLRGTAVRFLQLRAEGQRAKR
jgi:ferritin-like metal-binding protein YciE